MDGRILKAQIPTICGSKQRGNDYGDWLAIGSETPKDMIATAYWAYDASLMKRMAMALDRTQDERNTGGSSRRYRVLSTKHSSSRMAPSEAEARPATC